ncbi:hypothetical protein SVIOM342S_03583 [Streptomyces violaceorubidus]
MALRTRYAGPDTLAFSPDGRTLATAHDDRTIQSWNAEDPSHPAVWASRSPATRQYVNTLVFSPDGRTLASGGADDAVRLWDVTDPAHATRLGAARTGHLGPVNVLAYSPDGRTLASESDDGTVRLRGCHRGLAAHPGPRPRSPGHTDGGVADVQPERLHPGQPAPTTTRSGSGASPTPPRPPPSARR